jgi:glutamyl-tRNA synthetase
VPYLKPHLARLGIECSDDNYLAKVVVAQRERVKTLKEMAVASCYFFGDSVEIDSKARDKHLTPEALALLGELTTHLAALTEWTAASVHAAVQALAEGKGLGLGKVAQPLRVAVTGNTISPPIDLTLELLGRQRTLSRLERAQK